MSMRLAVWLVAVLVACSPSLPSVHAFRILGGRSADGKAQVASAHRDGAVANISRSDVVEGFTPAVMAAYNIAISVQYAIKTVDEMRFHTEGFEARLGATAEVAQSHLKAMNAASKGTKEMRADGWLALKSFDKLLTRVADSCEYEHKGSWIQRALGHDATNDEGFAKAVSTLRKESRAVSESLRLVAKTSLCPALREEAHQQILAAAHAAESYARKTGKSLYLKMAKDTHVTVDMDRFSYVSILSKDCFVVDDSLVDHLKGLPVEAEEEIAEEFENLFDRASVPLNEWLSTCPGWQTNPLPDESYAVAMCVPPLRDALLDAKMIAATFSLLAKLGPVQRWLESSALAINTIFDTSSLWLLLQAGTDMPAWFSSVIWLGYRAALHVPIRGDCMAAARSLTTMREPL